ncbi:MAG TPA: hypothetical protein VGA59_03705 [Ramlibacter sp.]|jgi:hypothetical protein
MTTLVQPGLLSQVLSHIPSRVLKALDAWSYRVALRRAERRRLAHDARARRAAAIVAQYRNWSH